MNDPLNRQLEVALKEARLLGESSVVIPVETARNLFDLRARIHATFCNFLVNFYSGYFEKPGNPDKGAEAFYKFYRALDFGSPHALSRDAQGVYRAAQQKLKEREAEKETFEISA